MLKRWWASVPKRMRRLLAVYAFLLIASHLTTDIILPRVTAPASPPDATRDVASLPRFDGEGPRNNRPIPLSFLVWSPEQPDAGRPPIVLLHGSPAGQGGADWSSFAPLLADAGYTVYALDLPGFGDTPADMPSYSAKALARLVLALLEEEDIERAHVVGWSFGGGVAIYMDHFAPERLASLTLLGSIGAQETEGSGDYYFEHAKYALGFVFVVGLPELIPHFGLLGPRSLRYAFIRNFWDSDQRPMGPLLKQVRTPTLILHGRDDFLVAAWAAERHHELVEPSRLVMLDSGHFFPFWTPALGAEHLLAFTTRHDDPGVPALRQIADMAPTPEKKDRDLGPFSVARDAPWWLIILIIIIATFISEDATVIAVGLFIANGQIAFSIGLLGCFLGIAIGDGGLWALGRFVGRRALHWPIIHNWLPERALDRWGRAFDRHAVKAVFLARAVPGTRLPTYIAAGLLSKMAHRFLFWAALAALIWTPLLLIITIIVGPKIHDFFEHLVGGPLALVAALISIWVLIRVVELSTTRTGRIRLRVAMLKPFRLEFWPLPIFYLPVIPYLVSLGLRHRGIMTFTCINPGVPHGGGVVGESKMQIIRGLIRGGADRHIVPTEFIDSGPTSEARADAVEAMLGKDGRFPGYPFILKPDESQRGHGVKLIDDVDELREYFVDMTRPALMQAFHPGPHEVGVLWSRVPGRSFDEPGCIFSVTRKIFPVVEGDGERTLERLIWDHPRYRMQADTFLKRFAEQTDRVLEKGERFSLAVAGNHTQGTMFVDGADLITPEFEQRLDEIARGFDGGEFDFGRFDIRYESDDDLRQGRNFQIVELNGTMSESTNIYDPGKSIWWVYSVLFRQWRWMYRIGAQRRRAGVRRMSAKELIVAIRDHYRGRPGASVSD